MGVPTRSSGNSSGMGPLVPKGLWPAVVTDASEGPTKKSAKLAKERGDPSLEEMMLTLEFEVYAGEGKPKSMKYWVVYIDTKTGDPSWRSDNLVETLLEPEHDSPHYVNDDGVPDPNGSLPPSLLIGRQVMVDVVHEDEQYNGKDRTRDVINRLERHKDGPIVDWKPGTTSTAEPESVAEYMGVADDDLPFDRPYFA